MTQQTKKQIEREGIRQASGQERIRQYSLGGMRKRLKSRREYSLISLIDPRFELDRSGLGWPGLQILNRQTSFMFDSQFIANDLREEGYYAKGYVVDCENSPASIQFFGYKLREPKIQRLQRIARQYDLRVSYHK